MKRFWLILLALAVTGRIAAQDVVAPRYQGGDMQHFMARLAGEFRKIVDETQTPAAELSPAVAVAFRIDTAGTLYNWRYIGNTSEGRDRVEVAPATPRVQELMDKALARLDGSWTPAVQNDRPVDYGMRLTLRIPVEKIAAQQNPDPLLFMGMNPDKSFHPWATNRIHFDGRFTERGVEGLVEVRFYIEPDGRITMGEVVRCPYEKLAREVIRVIKSSKGKWTPRKVRGVPQRTAYDYRVNFSNN